MTTIDCPTCGEPITAHVIQDSDGDASIPYGVRHFTAVEDMEQHCDCPLTDAERDELVDKLAERGSEPFDPADDPLFPY